MRQPNDMQIEFLRHYLAAGRPTFLNATRAAEAAGYSWPNTTGPRLASSPTIRPIIKRWLAALPDAEQIIRGGQKYAT